MAPYTHLTNDIYLGAYRSEVRSEIRTSRTAANPIHAVRRYVARGLVRTGAWLIPEKTDVIGATVSLLSDPRRDGAERRAA